MEITFAPPGDKTEMTVELFAGAQPMPTSIGKSGSVSSIASLARFLETEPANLHSLTDPRPSGYITAGLQTP